MKKYELTDEQVCTPVLPMRDEALPETHAMLNELAYTHLRDEWCIDDLIDDFAANNVCDCDKDLYAWGLAHNRYCEQKAEDVPALFDSCKTPAEFFAECQYAWIRDTLYEDRDCICHIIYLNCEKTHEPSSVDGKSSFVNWSMCETVGDCIRPPRI